jgi:hypothetical protein
MKFSSVFSICAGAVASFSGVSALTVSKTGNPFLLSDELVSQARDSLNESYGSDAVKVFDAFVETTNSKGGGAKELIESLSDAANHLAQDTMAKSSFLGQQMQSLTKGSAIDLPCTSKATCAVAELAANKCNYGRMLATGSYQSVNILTHIVSTVTSLGCGCFYTPVVSECILKSFYLCEAFNNVRSKLQDQSDGLWKSIQDTTKACRMHGSALIVGV